MIIIGINDIGAKCGGKTFKECRIVFRKNINVTIDHKIKLSNLTNIRTVRCKENVICYCDGMKAPITIKKKKDIYEILEEKEEHEYIDLEDQLSKDYLQREDEQEEMELLYHKDKKRWISKFSKNERLLEAISLGYECDDEYIDERIAQEYPGFTLVDHTTIFYKAKYPSREAMMLEKTIDGQLLQHKSKYGTYTRIGLLEIHNHVKFNEKEIVVILNYLNKFDIFAIVTEVIHEQQQQQQLSA